MRLSQRIKRKETNMPKQKGTRLIANNKKAYHEFFVEEK